MSNYDCALMAAIDRDLRDSERLQHLIDATSTFLDSLIPDLDALEHPCRRWHPGDLADDLTGHLKAMRHELNRVRSPSVVIDEDAYCE